MVYCYWLHKWEFKGVSSLKLVSKIYLVSWTSKCWVGELKNKGICYKNIRLLIESYCLYLNLWVTNKIKHHSITGLHHTTVSSFSLSHILCNWMTAILQRWKAVSLFSRGDLMSFIPHSRDLALLSLGYSRFSFFLQDFSWFLQDFFLVPSCVYCYSNIELLFSNLHHR